MVPDEDYSRKMLCAINLIDMYILSWWYFIGGTRGSVNRRPHPFIKQPVYRWLRRSSYCVSREIVNV
jgi:hypothetical protein